MTTTQQQVVMVPIHEGQITPTVVVIQQPATGHEQYDQGNRFSRWAYLIFGIGMGSYNFLYMNFWFVRWATVQGYGSLFFFCGVIPSVIGFIWMISDSTVFCCNPGTGHINKICCCECVNGWVMAVPMAIAALLRFILWCAFLGHGNDGIAADILNDFEEGEWIDSVFWLILSIGSIDVGPFILCAIDWWWYYGKRDYNGLFGHKLQPLRCITGASIVMMICSWSLIVFWVEYADDVAKYIWPWIIQGILSTAILIFAAFLQFLELINGAFVDNEMLKFISWGLGGAQAMLVLIVWGFTLDWLSSLYYPNGSVEFIIIMYCVYYGGITIPVSWCLFSIKNYYTC